MLNRKAFMCCLVVLSTLAVGCGATTKKNSAPAATTTTTQVQKTVATSQISTSLGDNAPFSVRTGESLVKPQSTWNAKPLSSTTYNDVHVLDESGKPVTLDVSKSPILFEAYWCPHCQRTLVLLSSNMSDIKSKPILVSTGFAPNTTIQQAVSISHQEFKSLNLAKFKVYYLLDKSLLAKYVVSYPTLVFDKNGKAQEMLGEHTLPLWERALS